MSVDAVVLAGGASTRFGGDKLAASVGGDTVLGRSVTAARAVADRVVIVLGPQQPDPALDDVVVARDAVAHRGPLAGLLTGLEALTGSDLVLVLAGDMPSVRPAVLALMTDRLRGDRSIAVVHLESEPIATLPLATRSGLIVGVVRDLLDADRRSLRAMLDAVATLAIPRREWRAIDPEGRSLLDVDTPGDLPLP